MSFYIDIDNQETFEKVTKDSKICVVDFYTTWCNPCKKLSVQLEETVKKNPKLFNLHTSDLNNLKNKIAFIKVNIDKNLELCEPFNVTAIPLICFYKNGVLCSEKVVGANLEGIIENLEKITTIIDKE